MKNFSLNERGMALMMVLTIIGILTALMYTFKFDSLISKLKSYNIQNRTQAKLNAQAGLTLAIARLEIYKEAFNYAQKNKQVMESVGLATINKIWEFPLMFPIPLNKKAGPLEKSAIETFEKNSLLNGGMNLTIESASHQLNLNLLRVSKLEQLKRIPPGTNYGAPTPTPSATPETKITFDELFVDIMEQTIQKRRITDDTFNRQYSALNPELLIATIKFYVSDRGTDIGPFSNQLESDFSKSKLTPKYAPMSSISELSLLPHWDDNLIKMFKAEFTVYGQSTLDLNKFSQNIIRWFMPNITDEQIQTYYKKKNDPAQPINFGSKKDFIQYFAETARAATASDLEEKFKKFEALDVRFSSAPQVFKVSSTGTMDNAQYTINSIVYLPSKATAVAPPNQESPSPTPSASPSGEVPEKKIELENPVVLEMNMN
ncbi:MAG: type II secretion system protein GspK [Bacteriovoracaceae bacterium]|nr:type II secretion system protein GspK [Bacteriovoracaceae bacterium]